MSRDDFQLNLIESAVDIAKRPDWCFMTVQDNIHNPWISTTIKIVCC